MKHNMCIQWSSSIEGTSINRTHLSIPNASFVYQTTPEMRTPLICPNFVLLRGCCTCSFSTASVCRCVLPIAKVSCSDIINLVLDAVGQTQALQKLVLISYIHSIAEMYMHIYMQIMWPVKNLPQSNKYLPQTTHQCI